MTTETKWVAVQTNQGTWVKVDNGHAHGPDSKAVAMVYAPEAHEVAGTTMTERVANSDAMALATATRMAATPEVERMLREFCEAHWSDADAAKMRATVRKAEALLKTLGAP